MPGIDCGPHLNPDYKIPDRNPNAKRSMSCRLFGVGCNRELNQIKRKKREEDFSYEDDSDGKKPKCLSDEPAGDCENNNMEEEAKAQEYLKLGGNHRNPGK